MATREYKVLELKKYLDKKYKEAKRDYDEAHKAWFKMMCDQYETGDDSERARHLTDMEIWGEMYACGRMHLISEICRYMMEIGL